MKGDGQAKKKADVQTKKLKEGGGSALKAVAFPPHERITEGAAKTTLSLSEGVLGSGRWPLYDMGVTVQVEYSEPVEFVRVPWWCGVDGAQEGSFGELAPVRQPVKAAA